MTDAQTSEKPLPAAPQETAPKETEVEFHKPKPVHSWREFLSEIGVVVIGVCIALSAEQAVEWWHWRGQVREARAVIATEMANNLVGAVLRLRIQGCIERRLDTLTDIVDAASRSGQLPAVGDIGQPPPRQWRSGAWQSLVAAETATHFPRQQLADLASLYQVAGRMEGLTQLNLEAWNELYPMIGPGRRFDAASEADLRKALSLARAVNRNYASLAMTLVQRTLALGLPFNGEALKQIADAKRDSLTTRPTVGGTGPISSICDPIGAVPPRYGQSYFALVPASSDRALKTLSDFSSDAP